MEELIKFIERLKKIGIKVELFSNYPWVYLDKVNDKKITEKLESEHRFTIYFSPIKIGQKGKFTDLKKIFEAIRKYK